MNEEYNNLIAEGDKFKTMGRGDTAIEFYKKAVAQMPDNYIGWVKIGTTGGDLESFASALRLVKTDADKNFVLCARLETVTKFCADHFPQKIMDYIKYNRDAWDAKYFLSYYLSNGEYAADEKLLKSAYENAKNTGEKYGIAILNDMNARVRRMSILNLDRIIENFETGDWRAVYANAMKEANSYNYTPLVLKNLLRDKPIAKEADEYIVQLLTDYQKSADQRQFYKDVFKDCGHLFKKTNLYQIAKRMGVKI